MTATTAELLLAWDQQRPRSRQTELGMSELGGCRRRAGYRLAGAAPTNPAGSVQAVMGTAVHSAVEQIHRQMQADGQLPADDLVEHEVRFAGVLGHLDRYVAAEAEIRDTKTTSQRWLDHIILHGPDQAHIWQTHLYGAALVAEGKPVRRVVIDYLARDTGNDHQVSVPFQPAVVKDALDWLRTVRETPLEYLNRDYAPDSSFCGHCPFYNDCWGGGVADRDPRSVLYVENPDAASWAAKLADAKARKAQAEDDEAEARGALDALRTISDKGSEIVVIDGFDKAVKFTITEARRIDTKAVKAEYAKTGASPPMLPPSQSVRVEFTARPAEANAA